MKGVYQHCGEKHLHRYVAEFDFRYNNRSALGIEDAARATKALQGINGKSLGSYTNLNFFHGFRAKATEGIHIAMRVA
jgi:hypothetical protein